MIWALLGLMLGLAVVMSGREIAAIHKYPGLKARERGEVYKLSWPAKEILSRHCKLPAEHQGEGLLPVLKAIEVKYGGRKKIDTAFTTWGWDYSYKSWSTAEAEKMTEFQNLRMEINGIHSDLHRQKREMDIYSSKHGVEQAQDILEQFRRERELINEVTKELTT